MPSFRIRNFPIRIGSGERGIRTLAPLRTNGFQDRLVMTTSISLQSHTLRFKRYKSCRPFQAAKRIITKYQDGVNHFFNFFSWFLEPKKALNFKAFSGKKTSSLSCGSKLFTAPYIPLRIHHRFCHRYILRGSHFDIFIIPLNDLHCLSHILLDYHCIVCDISVT